MSLNRGPASQDGMNEVFHYDKVFDENDNTNDVYEDVCSPIGNIFTVNNIFYLPLIITLLSLLKYLLTIINIFIYISLCVYVCVLSLISISLSLFFLFFLSLSLSFCRHKKQMK